MVSLPHPWGTPISPSGHWEHPLFLQGSGFGWFSWFRSKPSSSSSSGDEDASTSDSEVMPDSYWGPGLVTWGAPAWRPGNTDFAWAAGGGVILGGSARFRILGGGLKGASPEGLRERAFTWTAE